MANKTADRVPAVVTRTGRRRQFSEEDKRLIVEETLSTGPVAVGGGTPLRHRPGLLFRWRRALGVGGSGAPTSFVSVGVTDNPPARPQTLDEPPGPATPTIIVERPVSGIEIERPPRALRSRYRCGNDATGRIGARGRRSMMLIPAGIKIHLALAYTDLRKGIDRLGSLVERVLELDPFTGHLFVFRRSHPRTKP
jgi:hypothetical protein